MTAQPMILAVPNTGVARQHLVVQPAAVVRIVGDEHIAGRDRFPVHRDVDCTAWSHTPK